MVTVAARWDGGHFRYNTAVSHVNSSRSHNTYSDRTVVNNNSAGRSSFHGTGGGSRPAAAHQSNNAVHTAPVHQTAKTNNAPQQQHSAQKQAALQQHAAQPQHMAQPQHNAPQQHAMQPQHSAPQQHASQPQHSAYRNNIVHHNNIGSPSAGWWRP